MPDITMCSNRKCPLAPDCYRSTESGTTPSRRQSMAFFKPTFVGLSDHEPDHPGFICDHYWPTTSRGTTDASTRNP